MSAEDFVGGESFLTALRQKRQSLAEECRLIQQEVDEYERFRDILRRAQTGNAATGTTGTGAAVVESLVPLGEDFFVQAHCRTTDIPRETFLHIGLGFLVQLSDPDHMKQLINQRQELLRGKIARLREMDENMRVDLEQVEKMLEMIKAL